MQLNLDTLGRIAADYPATYYRVETWNTGKRVADFTTQAEAAAFAITDAKVNGCRYDHKVATMRRTRG